jgi:hypothetical protein
MVLKSTSASILKITAAALGLLLSHLSFAACVEGPTNVWECTGTTAGPVLTGNTDDTVTILPGATVNGDLDTEGGADTVTNYGTVTGDVRLDGGSDLVRNLGVVGGIIRGANGNDIIENGGSAGQIRGGNADDVVTLIDGATSTTINGVDGFDTLVFQFSGLSPADMQAIDVAVAANLAQGSVTVAGQTYNWNNMELLVNNSVLRSPAAVPTLSELALILLSLLLAGLALVRRPVRMRA